MRKKALPSPPATPAVPSTASLGPSRRSELRYCRTPNDAPEAPFLRSNRRIDSNYFRFKAKCLRKSNTARYGIYSTLKAVANNVVLMYDIMDRHIMKKAFEKAAYDAYQGESQLNV